MVVVLRKTLQEDVVSRFILYVILHIILNNGGSRLANLPKFVHGNKLDRLACVET